MSADRPGSAVGMYNRLPSSKGGVEDSKRFQLMKVRAQMYFEETAGLLVGATTILPSRSSTVTWIGEALPSCVRTVSRF